jgi:hypothetical protein
VSADGVARGKSRKVALDRLARLIRGPRLVVTRIFNETCAAKGGAPSLEAIASDLTNDTEVYGRALRRADIEGWLKEFCVRLIQAEAVEVIFARRTGDLFGRVDSVPQATFDPYNVSHDPLVESSRQRNAAPQSCRIDIDGHAAGTGFLVKPHLALTGYHVIAPLIEHGKERDGSEVNRTGFVGGFNS